MDCPLTHIGPYRLERVLGQGGMGVVYQGCHQETGALAALKTVIEFRASKLSQMRREAQALVRLNHPGVVRILGHGSDQGYQWYAMELLKGQTLRDAFRRFWKERRGNAAPLHSMELTSDASAMATASLDLNPAGSGARVSSLPWPYSAHLDVDQPASFPGVLPSPDPGPLPAAAGGHLAEGLGLIQRLCETLAYVHGEGILHRDLKPSNVFIHESGLPVLVDFGLVVNAAGMRGREVLDGDSAWVAGSTQYMAPEQIRGELLDARCDLYAVGCLLYELIVGQVPFSGAFSEVLHHHLHVAPRPPSELVQGISPDLERLVLRLLAKDRRDRVGYAQDVAALLEGFGATAPAWDTPLPWTNTYLYRPPLVGRKESLQQLDANLLKPACGEGSLVLVQGESGVGKTRLALEVALSAQSRNLEVVTGGCEALPPNAPSGMRVQGAPLHPWQPLLRAMADHCIEKGPEETRRILGDQAPLLAAYEQGLAEVPGFQGMPEPTPLPASAAKGRLFRTFGDALTRYAQAVPTVCVLDDLQWADELSLGFLEHLAEGPLAQMGLLLIGTYRSEDRCELLSRLVTSGKAQHLPLRRLSESDIGAMVEGMLSVDSHPAAFVHFLSEKSEGNPFFVAEYLRAAVGMRVLVRDRASRWTFADSDNPTEILCESIPLPRSLHDLVASRYRDLDGEALELLRAGVVLGREFDPEIAQAVAGLGDTPMLGALEELISRQVLEPAGREGRVRFAHDKLREIPYAELAPQVAQALHRKVAEVLEARFTTPERLAEWDAALGEHWLRALQPARALPCLHRAAIRAEKANALNQAIALYRLALEARASATREGAEALLHPGDSAGVLHERLGDALALSGNHGEARESLLRGIEALGSDCISQARLHRKLGKTWEIAHDHAQSLACYAEAEKALSRHREDEAGRREWIQIQLNRMWVYYWQVRVDDMNALTAEVGPLVEAHGSALQRSNYYQSLVLRDYRQHRYVISEATLDMARASVAAALEAKAPSETAFARFVLGFGLLFASRLDEAEAELFTAQQATRRAGDVTAELRSLAYLGLTHRRAGRLEETRHLSQQTFDLSKPAGMKDYLGLAQSGLGWVALQEGKADGARQWSQQALDTWAELNYPYPFQWAGGLTLLAVEAASGPLAALHALAVRLLQPGVMRLPDPLNTPLEKAVSAYEGGDLPGSRQALLETVEQAKALGFL